MFTRENRDDRSARETNQSRVLQALNQRGPTSRIKLAEITGLNPSTISRAVNDLCELNLVREKRVAPSSGGRKPVLIDIDKDQYQVIGVDIGATKIIAAVINLAGEIVEKVRIDIDYQDEEVVDLSPRDVLSSIERLLKNYKQAEKNSEKSNGQIIGIGVGAHGLVDTEAGVSLFAPNFGWENVNLQQMIEDEFSHRTIIDNDVRVMALGEYWFGYGQNADNILCVNVGYGIGSGIIFEGELYRGHNSMAGEIGHTTVLEDGPRCNCGDYGCLEAVASGPAIAKQMRKRLKRGYESKCAEMVGGDINKITGKLVGEAAAAGDESARKILNEAGNHLGIGIANTVNLLNPELVLIGGGVANSGSFVLDSLRQTVARKTMVSTPNISPVKLVENAGVIGAGVLIMKELFRTPTKYIKIRV